MPGSFDSLTDNDLEWLSEVESTVAVVFWREACAPCAQLDRVLMSISADLPESVEIRSAAVHENPKLVDKFSISSVPTMVLLNDGVEVNRLIGVERPQQLKRMLVTAGGNP